MSIARTAVTPGIVVTSPTGRINVYGASSFGDLGNVRLNAPVVAVSA